MKGMEYIIVGDINGREGLLVCLAGRSLEAAQEALEYVKAHPREAYTNLRIEEVESAKQWWNMGSLD